MVASPWLGPSWHPAFATVHAARKACEKSDAASIRHAKSKPKWLVELDEIYGKDFLDDLQLALVLGLLLAQLFVQVALLLVNLGRFKFLLQLLLLLLDLSFYHSY